MSSSINLPSILFYRPITLIPVDKGPALLINSAFSAISDRMSEIFLRRNLEESYVGSRILTIPKSTTWLRETCTQHWVMAYVIG